MTTLNRRNETAHRTALLVAVSLVAGLLVAGVALPVVGGLGVAVRKSVEEFNKLPSELRTPPLPQRTRILAADGSVLATFYYENRVSVPLSEIAPVMRQAIVAIEDDRFYQHGGVDIKGILRAVLTNSRAGSIQQGASTITQQYVKNVLIEQATSKSGQQAAHELTLDRKIREVRYAIALESTLSKDEILNRYLNIAFFGAGAYGVEAAARRYFGIHARDLDLSQAALLAGLVQSPTYYNPLSNPRIARERRDTVLARMKQLGYVSDTAAAAAEAKPLGLHPTDPSNGCENSNVPFFCDYVVRAFKANSALGRTVDDRTKLLVRGGLDIHTTLNRKVQKAAQHAVDANVPRSSRFAGVIAMVQPGTGHVLALAQNRDYGLTRRPGSHGAKHTVVNLATDHDFGGSTGFQSGSTFKVFTLAAALDEGIPLSLTINAPNTVDYGALGPENCKGDPVLAPGKTAGNAEGHGGTYNLLTGTWYSINTFYLELEKRVGLCKIKQVAQSMGVRQALAGSPALEEVPSLTLGVEPVSPLDMANAYATFAAHGKYCPAQVLTKVTDSDGNDLDVGAPDCKQVIDRGIADTVTAVLEGVIQRGTGVGLSIGRPAAGKTGTVTSFAGGWFIGYTPQISAAAMVVDPLRPQTDPLLNVSIGGRLGFVSEGFGATVAGPIWQMAMLAAMSGRPVIKFPPADTSVAKGKTIAVPDVTGFSPEDAQRALRQAGLDPILTGKAIRSTVAAGSVAATNPPAGAAALPGESVYIYLSNGIPPPVQPTPGGPGSPSPSPAPSPSSSPVPAPSPSHKPHPTHRP